MKDIIFVLAFILIGVSVYASVEKTKNHKEHVPFEITIDLKSADLISHYCAVEDGHFRGEGHGRTARQACRRARRELRRSRRDG